jgi:hypothetical protein
MNFFTSSGKNPDKGQNPPQPPDVQGYAQALPVGANQSLPMYPSVVMGVAFDETAGSRYGAQAPSNVLLPQTIDESAARAFLTSNGWCLGLQNTLLKNLTKTPIRFIICDDSGSMMSQDGYRIVKMGANCRWVIAIRQMRHFFFAMFQLLTTSNQTTVAFRR